MLRNSSGSEDQIEPFPECEQVYDLVRRYRGKCLPAARATRRALNLKKNPDDDMEEYFDPEKLKALGFEAWQWFIDHVMVWPTAVQAGIVILALLVARWVAPGLARITEQLKARPKFPNWLQPVVQAILPLCFAIVWLVLQWFSIFASRIAESPSFLIEIVVSLLSAWIVIRFASGFVRNRAWARTLAIIAWSVAALNIVGLLDATMETLDAMAFSFGDIRLSVLGVLKAGVVLAVFLWLAGAISRQVEATLTQANALSPSARVLLASCCTFC